ncbi:MAG: undecaprenyl-phosphate glucose phosphotransferase [Burkholderiaceae bacterium]|jgi:putative colanic acid biosynthesis UDP-glucose lipid carrier transferase|nr:undecaprenyl-phosphate glucose phosphotransferase [Gemmatimonadales bacterium]MCO5119381.1 undecaprenyl-phosphate glucose phosphotransferase [Burkholderiaceae bacterium]
MAVPSVSTQGVRQGAPTLIGFAKSLVDPLLILLMLGLSTIGHGYPIRGAEVVLGLITFSLTYPGTIPFRHRKLGLLREIAGSWGMVVALLMGIGYATGFISAFETRVLVGWMIATPAVLFLVHWSSPYFVPKVLALQHSQIAIVIGANASGRRLARVFNTDPFGTTRVIAFFDDRESQRLGEVSEAPIAGRVAEVANFVRSNGVHQIYVALPMASQPRILKLLDDLRDTTASIYFVPDIFMYDLIQARVDAVGGIPIVAVCESPFHGTVGLTKRLSDLFIATTAIILTAPVMLAIAIAIKIAMPGPVLFKQRRYGLDGREITVWKFRSMKVAEDGANVRQATKDDDRITPLGRFLRRTSLDELPQFFNVLQGRMSVVGPRPHAVSHNELFRKVIKGYMVRHKVKPGITGWAQINGARGETAQLEDMERRIRYDLEYLRQWSLRLDLYIIWRTIRLVFKDPQAY